METESSYPEIHKAVIPAGGEGRRLRPLSYVVPKELFPIRLRPMIEYAVAEATQARIHEICIVVSPDKEELIRAYFDAVPPQNCSIEYVVQPRPAGLMDAVQRTADFTGDDPFAVLLPDNLFQGEPPIRELSRVWAEHGTPVVGLASASPETASAFGPRGVLRVEPLSDAEDDRTVRVTAFGAEKEPVRPGEGERLTVGVGRYIFDRGIHDRIRSVRERLTGGELDDGPVVSELAEEDRMLGRHLAAEYFDVGNPIGYWRGVLRFSPAEELVARVVAQRGRTEE